MNEFDVMQLVRETWTYLQDRAVIPYSCAVKQNKQCSSVKSSSVKVVRRNQSWNSHFQGLFPKCFTVGSIIECPN